MPNGRLDPPLRMVLDEVVSICPVPLPAWMSDSGGKGVTIAAACHSIAQLRSRWRQDGAAAILSTAGTRVWLTGTADVETVDAISKLSGSFTQRERFHDHHTRHQVVDAAMARSLPTGYGIILRGGLTVTIARLEQAWRTPEYKHAKRHGYAVAQLPPPVTGRVKGVSFIKPSPVPQHLWAEQ